MQICIPVDEKSTLMALKPHLKCTYAVKIVRNGFLMVLKCIYAVESNASHHHEANLRGNPMGLKSDPLELPLFL
jgi:hypothetical protein